MAELGNLLNLLIQAPQFKLYTIDFTVSLFTEERLKHFEILSKGKTSLQVHDFIKLSMIAINQEESERVYLAYGLLKVFEEICRNNNKQDISFLDFTSFVVDKLPKLTQQVKIQEKVLPYGLQIDYDIKRTLLAPQVYGKKTNEVKRLEPNFSYSDKQQHINRKVEKATYSMSCRQFVTLDVPSKELLIFNKRCVLQKTVETELQLANRQAIIISFAWSETEKRIGAIMANYSTSFWSSTDDFRFQINVPLKRQYLKDPPTVIYYLQCSRKWIKFDAKPSIYILSADDFEIVDQFHHSKLNKEKDDSLILSETTYHKLLIVAFGRKVLLISIDRKEIVSEIHNFKTDIHALCFSQSYQILLVCCFQAYITSFELSQFCDLTQKGKFQGHRSRICAIAAIQDTPMVISIQDDGITKLWDIRDLSCYQTFSAPSNIDFRQILQMQNSVCFVGSKLFVYHYESEHRTSEKLKIIDLRIIGNKIMLTSTESITFFNLQNGRINRVIKAIFQSDQIQACQYLQNQNILLVVNSKSLMKAIDAQNGSNIMEMQLGTGKPLKLIYEDDIKILFYCSDQGIYLFQHQITQSSFDLRRQITNHDGSITLVNSSCIHDIICYTYGGSVLYFYTHERARALGSLVWNQQIKDFKLLEAQRLVAILSQKMFGVVSYSISYGVVSFKIRYLIEDVWPIDVVSSKMWENQDEIVIASSNGIIKVIQKKFKGDSIVKQLDRSNYNPYRQNIESHKESYRRIKPSISKRQLAPEGINIVAEAKVHRREIAGLARHSQLFISVDIEGGIRMYKADGTVVGKMHIKNPLPEFWSNSKDRKTEKSQMEYVLEILEYLRVANPKFSRCFTVKDFLQSVLNNTYVTQIRHSRQTKRSLSFNTKELVKIPQNVITSLRQKKIIVEKQREEKRNLENYESLVKQTAKSMINAQPQAESQRDKQIINFFDEAAVQNAMNKGIKVGVMPPEVKELQRKLNAIANKSEQRSYISQLMKNKSTVSPIKLISEPKTKQTISPLNFYSTELIRERNNPRNALDLVKTLKNSLLQSKFSRQSTSLPRIKSLSIQKSPASHY